MVDYKHAFQKGLEAHESSVRAKAEIDQVFKEFAHEIHEASAGKITIKIQPRIADGGVKGTFLFRATDKQPRYNEIVAYSEAVSGIREPLCEIEIPATGYPVILRYGRIESRCYDRESLEAALQKLLEDPDTAGQLKLIMKKVDEAGGAG